MSNYQSFRSLPRELSSRGQHWAHLGPAGPRWAPRWPHEPCYQGIHSSRGVEGSQIYIRSTRPISGYIWCFYSNQVKNVLTASWSMMYEHELGQILLRRKSRWYPTYLDPIRLISHNISTSWMCDRLVCACCQETHIYFQLKKNIRC